MDFTKPPEKYTADYLDALYAHYKEETEQHEAEVRLTKQRRERRRTFGSIPIVSGRGEDAGSRYLRRSARQKTTPHRLFSEGGGRWSLRSAQGVGGARRGNGKALNHTPIASKDDSDMTAHPAGSPPKSLERTGLASSRRSTSGGTSRQMHTSAIPCKSIRGLANESCSPSDEDSDYEPSDFEKIDAGLKRKRRCSSRLVGRARADSRNSPRHRSRAPSIQHAPAIPRKEFYDTPVPSEDEGEGECNGRSRNRSSASDSCAPHSSQNATGAENSRVEGFEDNNRVVKLTPPSLRHLIRSSPSPAPSENDSELSFCSSLTPLPPSPRSSIPPADNPRCSNCRSAFTRSGSVRSALNPTWRLCAACKSFEYKHHCHRPLSLIQRSFERRARQFGSNVNPLPHSSLC
ncbi:hypothetical protein C8R43DRAFT_1044161 [Mycena crocata]|nr:hypothetical protein C8R43DRAFT_1044161 [Mycena crocata]